MPPLPQFTCGRSDRQRFTRLTLTGELDIATVPVLDHELREAEAATRVVVVDLGALEFIDSSGAELLLTARRRLRGVGKQLVFTAAPADVAWFLELIGVDRELAIVADPPALLPAPNSHEERMREHA